MTFSEKDRDKRKVAEIDKERNDNETNGHRRRKGKRGEVCMEGREGEIGRETERDR